MHDQLYNLDPSRVKPRGIILLEFAGDRIFVYPIAESDEQEGILIRAFIERLRAALFEVDWEQ